MRVAPRPHLQCGRPLPSKSMNSMQNLGKNMLLLSLCLRVGKSEHFLAWFYIGMVCLTLATITLLPCIGESHHMYMLMLVDWYTTQNDLVGVQYLLTVLGKEFLTHPQQGWSIHKLRRLSHMGQQILQPCKLPCCIEIRHTQCIQSIPVLLSPNHTKLARHKYKSQLICRPVA